MTFVRDSSGRAYAVRPSAYLRGIDALVAVPASGYDLLGANLEVGIRPSGAYARAEGVPTWVAVATVVGLGVLYILVVL